jgi:hypothetical protein
VYVTRIVYLSEKLPQNRDSLVYWKTKSAFKNENILCYGRTLGFQHEMYGDFAYCLSIEESSVILYLAAQDEI